MSNHVSSVRRDMYQFLLTHFKPGCGFDTATRLEAALSALKLLGEDLTSLSGRVNYRLAAYLVESYLRYGEATTEPEALKWEINQKLVNEHVVAIRRDLKFQAVTMATPIGDWLKKWGAPPVAMTTIFKTIIGPSFSETMSIQTALRCLENWEPAEKPEGETVEVSPPTTEEKPSTGVQLEGVLTFVRNYLEDRFSGFNRGSSAIDWIEDALRSQTSLSKEIESFLDCNFHPWRNYNLGELYHLLLTAKNIDATKDGWERPTLTEEPSKGWQEVMKLRQILDAILNWALANRGKDTEYVRTFTYNGNELPDVLAEAKSYFGEKVDPERKIHGTEAGKPLRAEPVADTSVTTDSTFIGSWREGSEFQERLLKECAALAINNLRAKGYLVDRNELAEKLLCDCFRPCLTPEPTPEQSEAAWKTRLERAMTDLCDDDSVLIVNDPNINYERVAAILTNHFKP